MEIGHFVAEKVFIFVDDFRKTDDRGRVLKRRKEQTSFMNSGTVAKFVYTKLISSLRRK